MFMHTPQKKDFRYWKSFRDQGGTSILFINQLIASKFPLLFPTYII